MKKYFSSHSLLWSITASAVFVFLVVGGVWADSTIGTNITTTGTFTITPAADSATSLRFQNAAGTNYFVADSTNKRIGVGAAPQTTFEVQGTSSASYLLSSNTLQVNGFASVAYNRFGTNATTHSISSANDLLITGILETDGKTFLDATASVTSDFEVGGMASIQGVLNLADGRIRSENNAVTGLRFQNAAGTTTVMTMDTTNFRVGIGGTPVTKFQVQGTASASYFITGNTIEVGGFASVAYNRFGTTATTHSLSATNDVLINGNLEVDTATFLDGLASVASNFEVVGYASASKGFFTTDLIVGGNVASSSTIYSGEFGNNSVTATSASFIFAPGGISATTVGTCFQLKDTAGAWVYARVLAGGSALTVNKIKCHN